MSLSWIPFARSCWRSSARDRDDPDAYAPNDIVTRLQMSAFSRTVDTILRREPPRTPANRHWNGQLALG
jgi:hypothetical protein